METKFESATECPVRGLSHVAIKAADLPATIAFYERVLGLRQVPRPPFGFPGAWLGTPDGEALIHLLGGARARHADGAPAIGTGVVDHVSLWTRGYEVQRARFEAFGLPYRSQRVPDTELAQLFVFDPNALMIELTYRLADEPGAVIGARGGVLRFERERYRQFSA